MRVLARPLLLANVKRVDVVKILAGEDALAADDEHALPVVDGGRRVRPSCRRRRARDREYLPRIGVYGVGFEVVGRRRVAAPAAKDDELLRPARAEQGHRMAFPPRRCLAARGLRRPPLAVLVVPHQVVEARDLAAAAKEVDDLLRAVVPRPCGSPAASVHLDVGRAAERRVDP